jgi:hypothetical protein
MHTDRHFQSATSSNATIKFLHYACRQTNVLTDGSVPQSISTERAHMVLRKVYLMASLILTKMLTKMRTWTMLTQKTTAPKPSSFILAARTSASDLLLMHFQRQCPWSLPANLTMQRPKLVSPNLNASRQTVPPKSGLVKTLPLSTMPWHRTSRPADEPASGAYFPTQESSSLSGTQRLLLRLSQSTTIH